MTIGHECADCSEPFSKDYQVPTLCNHCWNLRQSLATEGFLKADRRTEQSVDAARRNAKKRNAKPPTNENA